MEMQREKTLVSVDRLSELPESILTHILSLLSKSDRKQVVRCSVLSRRWRFLWMSVPVSLTFFYPNHNSPMETLDMIASIHRELYYWRSCKKIRKFEIYYRWYEERQVKDVDLWVHFATKVAHVEDFALGLDTELSPKYEFPQFAYESTSLRNLTLFDCQLNPSGSVNWSNLVSLTFCFMNLTEPLMEKVLTGCPNLECLELRQITGIHHLEITSVKLGKLIVANHINENCLWLEIFAPNLQDLRLVGDCEAIRIPQSNVASLITAALYLKFAFGDEEGNLEKECRYWKELLHSVAHVKNLELGSSCIEFLSILELRGWQSPPSRRKCLEFAGALELLDFPGICSFLQSSSDLETLVIDWFLLEPRDLLSKYTNEDEQTRRFETSNFNCSLLHLKTIVIKNYDEPPSENSFVLQLVRFLLKNATVLEKLVIAARFEGSDDVSWDYVTLTQELLSFPRSSPHASIAFSYR